MRKQKNLLLSAAFSALLLASGCAQVKEILSSSSSEYPFESIPAGTEDSGDASPVLSTVVITDGDYITTRYYAYAPDGTPAGVKSICTRSGEEVDGERESYTCNEEGQPESIFHCQLGNDKNDWVEHCTYDEFGDMLESETKYSNGMINTDTYDADGRLTQSSLSNAGVYSGLTRYTYGEDGRLLYVTEAPSNGQPQIIISYEYGTENGEGYSFQRFDLGYQTSVETNADGQTVMTTYHYNDGVISSVAVKNADGEILSQYDYWAGTYTGDSTEYYGVEYSSNLNGDGTLAETTETYVSRMGTEEPETHTVTTVYTYVNPSEAADESVLDWTEEQKESFDAKQETISNAQMLQNVVGTWETVIDNNHFVFDLKEDGTYFAVLLQENRQDNYYYTFKGTWKLENLDSTVYNSADQNPSTYHYYLTAALEESTDDTYQPETIGSFYLFVPVTDTLGTRMVMEEHTDEITKAEEPEEEENQNSTAPVKNDSSILSHYSEDGEGSTTLYRIEIAK